MRRWLSCFAIVILLPGVSSHAQTIPDEPDSSSVPVRFGPLWLRPTLSVPTVGVDTNVFNQAVDPESDFTTVVTPASDFWLHLGRTWMVGNVLEEFEWFSRFPEERSLNHDWTVGWLVPLNRVSFVVNGNWTDTRDRSGFEIDTRFRRSEQAVYGALEVRTFSRTFFGVRGERRKFEFDEDAIYFGNNLQSELNRTQTEGGLTMRHEMTPLTGVTLDVSRQQDRFEISPLRDSDSTHIALRLQFDQFALISGTAQIGFRVFTPLSSELPSYEGVTAAVGLTYITRGSTKLTVQANRDVEYSYDSFQPYYLQTGVNGSVEQHIYGPVDLEGRVGHERLAYRQRSGVVLEVSDRLDRVYTYRVGVGYRVGRNMRVGFNLEKQKRASDVELREYDGLRYGMGMTYGR